MKFTKPKLIPTLLCLATVGLFAAFLPIPGLQSGFVMPNASSK